jgi:hypothetical protein
LGESIDTIQNREALLDASKEVDLEVNSEKTKYTLLSRKKAGQKHSIKIANWSFEGVANSNTVIGNKTNGLKLHAGRD